MPWTSIKLVPGLNVELTQTLNQGGYNSTNLGRFRNGLFEKLGGWQAYYSSVFTGGDPKKLHIWQDLALNRRVAIATAHNLNDLTSGTLKDITPQTLLSSITVNFATTNGSPTVTIVDANITNVTAYDSVYFNTPVAVGGLILSGLYPIAAFVSAHSYTIIASHNATATVAAPGGAVPTFTTTSGSANVTVTLTAHGLIAGNDIVFPIATAVGGITISGRYIVQSVTSADAFVITAVNTASSSAGPTGMNSGNAQFLYYISLGPQAGGLGYGTGTYGTGTYGFGAALSGQVGTDITATGWSLDNWGELLIACPNNGGIYYWGPASGFQNCRLITDAPLFNTGAFVSIGQQIIVAYGSTVEATTGSYQDPLLVKWSDVGNFFQWTSLITNQAGSYRIPSGSRIIGGAATPYRNLIWTDQDIWSMDYIGAALAFGFQKIGSNCGLIAKHAHAQLRDSVYWMGADNFYILSGSGVQKIDCPVWDSVFQDIDLNNKSLCHTGINPAFSEVWFFYPSASAALGYCDRYAKYNVAENTWDIGGMDRQAWNGQSIIGKPLAITTAGLLYEHEVGNDAGGSPLVPSFETGWFYIDEGREIVFIDRIFPDFKWGAYNASQNAQIMLTIKSVMYSGNTPTVYGPFTITQATQYISQRLRARQISLAVSSSGSGSFWRLGAVRFRWSPDGRR